LDDVQAAVRFIELLKAATIDNTEHHKLSERARHRLRNPSEELIDLEADPGRKVSFQFAITNPTDENYKSYIKAMESIALPGIQFQSKHTVEKDMERLTGIEPIIEHMCINSCIGFTGPHAHLESCPKCKEDRYELRKSATSPKKPRKTFVTLPLAAIIQAFWLHPDSATRMQWRDSITKRLQEEFDNADFSNLNMFDDILKGRDYLRECEPGGDIKPGTTLLMFSIDGAQLYASKQSDCWIYIWVLLDLSPENRYKKQFVVPGAIIPGPNKPKDLDSFLFPGLYHIAAVQNEGLVIFDGAQQCRRTTDLFIFIVTADGPGMAFLTGLVGHHGKFACRLYCGFPGRRYAQKPHYYPVMKKPRNYNVSGCLGPDKTADTLPSAGSGDYDQNLARILACRTLAEYARARLETGIVKPTLFSGLRCTKIPHLFGSDIMHLAAINIPDLLIPLWRAKFTTEGSDKTSLWDWAFLKDKATWEELGRLVELVATHLPGSFDRPPRNVAKKIHTGYKAWEFLLLMHGMMPALMMNILPEPYYTHYCRLVRGIRILSQHSISLGQIEIARNDLNDFADGFEDLYVDGRNDRIHFVRPWIHALTHLARETVRKGPPICSSQWTMERMIGDLGGDIRSHVNPFANLANIALRRARVNAMKSICPTLDPRQLKLPSGAVDLENGYFLLPRKDRYLCDLTPPDAEAHAAFLRTYGLLVRGIPAIQRRARLLLPNRQVACSLWKEGAMQGSVRMSRHVKLILPGHSDPLFAEVRYYYSLKLRGVDTAVAMVSIFDPPDPHFRQRSLDQVLACKYRGDETLQVIDITAIKSVVAMVPHNFPGCEPDDKLHYVIEKPGLDVAVFGQIEEGINE
ncbi:hypothetical protein CONPUDRAFT_27571, partial [Coniophora puteana RWD-64-598 SS2]